MNTFTQLNKWFLSIIVAMLFLVNSSNSNAQASITNYTLSSTSGTFTALSGATVPGLSSGNRDEGYINNMNIGFDFYYMGTKYTTISASTNGWLKIGGSISGAAAANNLTSGGSRPVIAPLWDDLNMNSGTMSYKTSGSAPNRTFTFEWLNAKWNFGASAAVISFQAILTETTGEISFVYRQQATAVNSGSASIGLTATSGGAGNFLSLDGTGASPIANSFVETSNLNAKPATGQTYTFTPIMPTAPTDLQITAISQTAMTLNWIDNSLNETGFVIYRSVDGGVTYTYLAAVSANTTSYISTSLTAGSLYYWKVAAISEGGVSSFEIANDYTLDPGTKVANTGTFDWSSTSAWVGGVVPKTTDSVVVPSGSTINITTSVTCISLTIDGTVNFVGNSSARTFTINKYLFINSGGSFLAGSSTAAKTLNIGGTNASTYGPGSLVCDGTFDVNMGANQTVATYFYGNNNSSISGSGATCDFYSINVNKGTTQSRIFEISRVITIDAPTASASRLVVTSGTLKISSASNLTPYYGSQTICASTGKIHLNHASAVLSVVSPGTTPSTGNATISGAFTIDNGTFNYGSGDNTFNISGGNLTLNGGTINFYGTVVFSNSISNRFTMTGGTFNVDPQSGDISRSNDVFYIHSSTIVNITGGTINIIDPNYNNAASKTEFIVAGTSASKNLSGLTLRLGNGVSSSSGSATTGGFVISIPSSITIDSLISNNPVGSDRIVKISGSGNTLSVAKFNNVAGTFNLNGNTLSSSTRFNNTGILDASSTSSQLVIGGTIKQTIAGTIISSQIGKLNITCTDTILFTPAINVLRTLTLTSGVLKSTGGITIGNGAANSFDFIATDGKTTGIVAYNYGTGTNNFTYNGTSAQVTGSELPATVATGTLTINNSNGVTLNSALSIQNATFTNGKLTTTSINLLNITSSSAGAVTKTSGYVSGPLRRAIPNNAANATYLFPVGKSTDNSLDLLNLTTSGAAGTLTVEVFDLNSGGTPGTGLTAINTNRYWSIAVTGGVTYTTNQFRITESGLTSLKTIARSATLTGAYNNIGGGISGSTITSSNYTLFNYLVIGDKATLAGGTYTVGTAATYPTLTAVATELNSKSITGNITFELTAGYTGAGETFPINFYKFDTSGGNWTVTIRVQNGVSTRTVAGAPGSTLHLISLNGVRNLTFDGRAGGIGSASALIFRNTRTTATQGGVFEFKNDASNNTLKYLQCEAQAQSASLGVITIGSTTGTTGNDSNTIEYNTVKDYLTKCPVNLIYAAGNALATNDYNTIRYNELYNDSINAIHITATGMGDYWTINNNNIYTNFGRNPSVAQTGIKVLAGNGLNIYNNNIGGTATNCGGSAWTNTGNITFEGMSLTLGTSVVSNIYSNKIQNISLTGGGAVTFNGISTVSGLMYIGTNGGNTIGHASTANSISLNGTSGTFRGIQISNSTSASKIENNTIANVTATNTAGSYTMIAIYTTGSDVAKNMIHSLGSNNSTIVPTIYGVWNKLTGLLNYDITNNGISLNGGLASNTSIYGYFENSTGSGAVTVFYNTINIYGGANSFNTYAFYRTSSISHLIKNNILFNNRTIGGGGVHAAVANTYASPSTNFTSDYNLVKSNDVANEIIWGVTPFDFPTFITAFFQELNSVNSSPVFYSNTSLKLDTNYNCQLNGKGTHIASFTSDIDGETRNTSRPDIGFDELPYMPYGKWFGYFSSAWNNTNNWCDLTIPTTVSDVEIDSTANFQPVISTGTNNCNNLTINAGASLTLSGADLNVKGNILNHGDLTTNINKIVLSGTSNQEVSTDSIENLELNNSLGAKLTSSLKVLGTLTLTSGKLNIDSFDLTMNTGSTVAGYNGSNYIQTLNSATDGGFVFMDVDNIGTQTFFPVGTTTYTPVIVSNTGVTSSSFKVRVFDGILANGTSGSSHSSINNAVNRTWLVENVNAGTFNVTLRTQWNLGDENVSFVRAWCGLAHYTSGAWSAGAPQAASAGTIANSYYVERNGLTSFSPFAVGDYLTPLPVKMTSFEAKANNKDAQINWSTATEMNSDRFDVERSVDGKNWIKVGEVKAQGNSELNTEYSFLDKEVSDLGTIYYRLNQVDMDGKNELSNVVAVSFGKSNTIAIQSVQPNPFNESINININLSNADQVTVKVIDMAGKIVSNNSYDLSKNNHNISIDHLTNIASGVYMLEISTASQTVIQKLMKN